MLEAAPGHDPREDAIHADDPAGGGGGLPRRFPRRLLVTGSVAAAAGLALARPASAAPLLAAAAPGDARDAEDRAVAFLRAMTDAYPVVNPGPRLAQSYADELGLFSTAFVYDNALAICAALSGGRADLALARTLGDGLVYATEHDPGYSDGRLRQAYNVGPYVFYDGQPQPWGFVRPDGTANVGSQFGFLGTAVGDMAWPGIALLQLHRRSRDERYLAAALRIADWIVGNTYSTKPLGGLSFGVNGANAPIPNGSTEHNIDCVAFFALLHRITRDDAWRDAEAHARAFVERMWEPALGCFYTGTNDGLTINRDPLPLDPQTWSWLALQDRRYAGALDWASEALAVTDSADAPNTQLPSGVSVSGVAFSTTSLTSTAAYNGLPVNPRSVWLEGTAQLATAFADRRAAGDRAAAEFLLTQVRIAQDSLGQGQRVGGNPLPPRSGVVAASSLHDSGFGFGYFPVQHVGASAWFVMASRRVNPMRFARL